MVVVPGVVVVEDLRRLLVSASLSLEPIAEKYIASRIYGLGTVVFDGKSDIPLLTNPVITVFMNPAAGRVNVLSVRCTDIRTASIIRNHQQVGRLVDTRHDYGMVAAVTLCRGSSHRQGRNHQRQS